MSLLVDDRAGSADLLSYPQIRSLSPILTRLSSGDIALSGNGPAGRLKIAAEIKSVPDYLTSLDNGRLQGLGGQLPRMLDEYDISWLLIYGDVRGDATGRLQYSLRPGEWLPVSGRPVALSDYNRALTELTAYGVLVWREPTIARAVQWIVDLHELWQKPWHEHSLMRTFDNSRAKIALPPGTDSRDPKFVIRAEIAGSIPGVGFEFALAAARQFTSAREMIAAPAAEWAKVEVPSRKAAVNRVTRIGPTRAKNIDWALS